MALAVAAMDAKIRIGRTHSVAVRTLHSPRRNAMVARGAKLDALRTPRPVLVGPPRIVAFRAKAAAVEETTDASDRFTRGQGKREEISRRSAYAKPPLDDRHGKPAEQQAAQQGSSSDTRIESCEKRNL